MDQYRLIYKESDNNKSDGWLSVKYTRSVQKILGLLELRGSSWFQGNPLGAASFVLISWLKRFSVADIFICWEATRFYVKNVFPFVRL